MKINRTVDSGGEGKGLLKIFFSKVRISRQNLQTRRTLHSRLEVHGTIVT